MEFASKELVGIISYLLPGFLAAWIFHGLTAHPKPQPFERVVQALIFTAILQGIVSIVRWFFLLAGNVVALGEWTHNVNLVWSLLWAVVLGLVAAGITNNDTIHAWLRHRDWRLRTKLSSEKENRWVWTYRTSHPSEWFSAFSHPKVRYVILHLKDGRRLFGWPDEWPDSCDRGHFVVSECEWLLTSGKRAALHRVESMLVPAGSVQFVEFLKYENEVNADDQSLRHSEDLLIRINQQESSDGKQGPTTTAEPTREVREEGSEPEAGSRPQAQAVASSSTSAEEAVTGRRSETTSEG